MLLRKVIKILFFLALVPQNYELLNLEIILFFLLNFNIEEV